MGLDVLEIFVSSLLSALVSSFLAAYFTYRYTELSWRKRRHFEDIKEVCLKEVLDKIDNFDSFFRFMETQVSSYVRTEAFFKGLRLVDWCLLFSFGFNESPTNHYLLLLQDLKNQFPSLLIS